MFHPRFPVAVAASESVWTPRGHRAAGRPVWDGGTGRDGFAGVRRRVTDRSTGGAPESDRVHFDIFRSLESEFGVGFLRGK